MQVRLNEDNELTITRFIKGLSPTIANMVKLQPYLSFNDACHLAINIEKQLKGRKPYPTPSPHHPQSTPRVSPSITRLTRPIKTPNPLRARSVST